MKIKKHVNINSVIARFDEMIQHCNVLKADFIQAIQLLDNAKLGISELNFNIDEEVARYRNTFAKLEDLLRSIQ